MKYLKFMILEALNPNGCEISLFDVDVAEIGSGSMDTVESAANRFYYVGEHTCPVNILGVKAVYDGSSGDPHGLIRLIGYIPEDILRDIDVDIYSHEMNSDVINTIIRVYKSIYHLVLTSQLRSYYSSTDLSTDFGKPFYLHRIENELASRINYLACEILKKYNKLPSKFRSDSYVIDSNHYNVLNDVADDREFLSVLEDANGLIGGFPEAIFRDNFIGFEKFKDIIYPVKDCDFLNLFDVDDYIESYYEGLTRVKSE